MTSVYRYMKLSVIVIPRISPSTAAARCQQDSTIHKTSFSSNEATASSFILPQKSFNPSSHPPQQQYFLSTHLFLRTCTCNLYLTLPYSRYLTSLSPHLFLTNPSERNHSSQCVVEAFRFTRPHFSISARLFMLMGSVEVGFQCSKSTMDLVEKKGRKKRDVRLDFKCKRGMGGGEGKGKGRFFLQCFGLSIPEDVSESAIVGGEAHSPYGSVREW